MLLTILTTYFVTAVICKLSSDKDFINQINFNSIQLLNAPFSINHCL